MLRALVALLVLLNGVYFAWSHDVFGLAWPGPSQRDREPGRLAAQVRPEWIRVVSPQAASAAQADARAARCLEAGPFSDADVAGAEALLAATGLAAGSWVREPATPQGWMLRVPQADGEARQRLQAEGASTPEAGFRACAPISAASAASLAATAPAAATRR